MNISIENVLEVLKNEIKTNFNSTPKINLSNSMLSVKLFNENTKKEYLFNIYVSVYDECVEYDIDTSNDFNKDNFLRNKSMTVSDMYSVICYLNECINSTKVVEVLTILEDAFFDDKFENFDIDTTYDEQSFTIEIYEYSKLNIVATYVETKNENSNMFKIDHYDDGAVQTVTYFNVTPEKMIEKCIDACSTYKISA